MRIVNAGDAGSSKLGDYSTLQASKGCGNGRRLTNLNPGIRLLPASTEGGKRSSAKAAAATGLPRGLEE